MTFKGLGFTHLGRQPKINQNHPRAIANSVSGDKANVTPTDVVVSDTMRTCRFKGSISFSLKDVNQCVGPLWHVHVRHFQVVLLTNQHYFRFLIPPDCFAGNVETHTFLPDAAPVLTISRPRPRFQSKDIFDLCARVILRFLHHGCRQINLAIQARAKNLDKNY